MVGDLETNQKKERTRLVEKVMLKTGDEENGESVRATDPRDLVTAKGLTRIPKVATGSRVVDLVRMTGVSRREKVKTFMAYIKGLSGEFAKEVGNGSF